MATVPATVRDVPTLRRSFEVWETLSNEIRTCRKCPLHRTRTHAVIYRGSLAPRLLFVGEAPGSAEDRTGVPFVGRAGQRLDAAVARLGLSPGDFGVLNLIKCRPPRNRFDRHAAAACRPYLDRQIDWLRPRILVTLGSRALHAFDPGAPPILDSAGLPRTRVGRPLFPLVHPAAAMRSRRLSERWARDLDALAAWLGEQLAQPV